MLLFTFFSCRLCWGTYQSVRVFSDIYNALSQGRSTITDPSFGETVPTSGIMTYASPDAVPLWLAGCYLLSNLTLNGLNWYWFGKMIETLRKRFDPPIGTRRPEKVPVIVNGTVTEKGEKEEKEDVYVEGIHIETPGILTPAESPDYISAVKIEKGANTLKVQQSEVRSRTTPRRRE